MFPCVILQSRVARNHMFPIRIAKSMLYVTNDFEGVAFLFAQFLNVSPIESELMFFLTQMKNLGPMWISHFEYD